jgi:hypothetical protein
MSLSFPQVWVGVVWVFLGLVLGEHSLAIAILVVGVLTRQNAETLMLPFVVGEPVVGHFFPSSTLFL